LVVVIGNFNFWEIYWINNLGGSGQGQVFLDVVGDRFLRQKVLAPTRGDNILNLILCSDPDIVKNLVV